MKIYSEITNKWYKTPGECLTDEELAGKTDKDRILKEKQEEAVRDLIMADKMVQLADAAMLVAANEILELYDLGGEMPKIYDLPFNNQLTLLQTLKGVRQKIEIITLMRDIEQGPEEDEEEPERNENKDSINAEDIINDKSAAEKIKEIVQETARNLDPDADENDMIKEVPEDINVVLFPGKWKSENDSPDNNPEKE